jgi:hypothetical protein
MTHKLIVSLVLLTAANTAPLFAHSVWIEPDKSNRPVIRFAEPTGNLERSPGHLDSLTAPMIFQAVPGSTNAPVVADTAKQKDHYTIVGGSLTNRIGVETSFTVRAGRKPLFYARWHPAGAGATEPLLTMDLVPTDQPGEARLFLRGKPHGGVNAVLLDPDGDEKEYPVDAEGFVRIPVTKPGLYLLTVAHQREPIAGVHLGVPYQETSHNCALSWIQQ